MVNVIFAIGFADKNAMKLQLFFLIILINYPKLGRNLKNAFAATIQLNLYSTMCSICTCFYGL